MDHQALVLVLTPDPECIEHGAQHISLISDPQVPSLVLDLYTAISLISTPPFVLSERNNLSSAHIPPFHLP